MCNEEVWLVFIPQEIDMCTLILVSPDIVATLSRCLRVFAYAVLETTDQLFVSKSCMNAIKVFIMDLLYSLFELVTP